MTGQEPDKTSIGKTPISTHRRSIISEDFIDAPSQRIYMLSIFLLCQAIKFIDYIQNTWHKSPATVIVKWLFVDSLYCLTLSFLRIPRLTYSKAVVLLQIVSLSFFDCLLFGGVQIGITLPTLPWAFEYSSPVYKLYEKNQDKHLLGEHTVRLSPISTASLNSDGKAFCLNEMADAVLIPVLLNNTNPSYVEYSISSFDSSAVEMFELNARELKTLEQSYIEKEHPSKLAILSAVDDEDDWDGEDLSVKDGRQSRVLHTAREKTQSVFYLRIQKSGIVRLHYIHDGATDTGARIFNNQVSVAKCPRAEFIDEFNNTDDIRCVQSKEEYSIRLFGMPPLSLKWRREINGYKEFFSVEGIKGFEEADSSMQFIDIPLNVSLSTPGSHRYVLESVADSVGNTVELPSKMLSMQLNEAGLGSYKLHDTRLVRSLSVLRRASMSFKECTLNNPAELLIGNATTLHISAGDGDPQDGPWTVAVRYDPDSQFHDTSQLLSFSMDNLKEDLVFHADSAGKYTLLSVNGRYCDGDVLSPESCRVLMQPFPTANIEWKGIHECSGDIGVSASLTLHGKPPFQLFLQQRRDNESPRELIRTFQGSRGEITLQPERSGNYTYSFVYLSDANYKKISLFGPNITQAVYPQASADLVLSNKHLTKGETRTLSTCSTDIVLIDVELRGEGPWNLTLQVTGPINSEMMTFTNLAKTKETLRIPIPQEITQSGGVFQVDLISIEDVFKCKRNLPTQTFTVNVRREKPTARFFTKQGKREIAVLEKGEAKMPLRLTGEGPWKVKYQRIEPYGKVTSAILQSANDYLRTNDFGTFELLEVSDSQCPGEVVAAEAMYLVEWIPRPMVKLAPETAVVYEASTGFYIRPPVCAGVHDYVDLQLFGSPPFEILYSVNRKDVTGSRNESLLRALQSRIRLQLHTSEAGRMTYDVIQTGDSLYPLSQNWRHVIPGHVGLTIEQLILARPSAYFKSSARLSYCMNDSFTWRSPGSDGIIFLEGQPPFSLELSVKDLGASSVHKETVQVFDTQWKISLPHYHFATVGPHILTIESVRDASQCDSVDLDALQRSIWVDVAETAAILPFDWREHLCLGDISEFQLEGTPPWTIGFSLNNEYQEEIVRQSLFSWTQQNVGNFSIKSISHQGNMCRTPINNLNLYIHPLPSAQVAAGKDQFENINEGGQAHIVFTLFGQPPFTFTYQRSEPAPRKGARAGKVLETHTVTGVYTNEYSLYSALEGTWTVKFISDKYCRYPPLQQQSVAS